MTRPRIMQNFSRKFCFGENPLPPLLFFFGGVLATTLTILFASYGKKQAAVVPEPNLLQLPQILGTSSHFGSQEDSNLETFLCGLSKEQVAGALRRMQPSYGVGYFYGGMWHDLEGLHAAFDRQYNATGNKPVCVLCFLNRGFPPCLKSSKPEAAQVLDQEPSSQSQSDDISDGCLLPYWLRPHTSDLPVLRSALDERGFGFLLPDYNFRHIVDAGGNVGIAAVLFASIYPNSRIVTIEPSSSNFEVLELNTRHLNNVVPIRAALWSTVRSMSLKTGRYEGHWAFEVTGEAKNQEDPNYEEVPAITLPFLFQLMKWTAADFVKIDIETAEEEVFFPSSKKPLFGGLDWIDSCKLLAIEVHEALAPGLTDKVTEKLNEKFSWRTWGELTVFTKFEDSSRQDKVNQAASEFFLSP